MATIYPNRNGEANANWRGGKEIPCRHCSVAFWVKPSHQLRRKFCSNDCANAWRMANPPQITAMLKLACKHCGKEFSRVRSEYKRRGSCCSRECFTAQRRNQVLLACHHCGVEYSAPAFSAVTSKFCSRLCQYAAKTKKRSPEEIWMRKLNARMSGGINHALRGRKCGLTWQSFVDFTLAELKVHLESKFRDGMSWSNIGAWHIDHIRPRVSFSFTEPSDPDFKACWSLNNLQPLWAVENMSKGAKMPDQLASALN